MKIIDRKTFLALPSGILFSKYEQCVFGALTIKGDTIGGIDFYAQPIADAVKYHDTAEFVEVLFDAAENGTSFPLDLDCEGRDGLFDLDQLFAVWERSDVEALIDRFTRLLAMVRLN